MQTCYSILLPGDIDDAAAAVCRRHNRVAAKLECILIQAKNYYFFVYDMCCPAAAAADAIKNIAFYTYRCSCYRLTFFIIAKLITIKLLFIRYAYELRVV